MRMVLTQYFTHNSCRFFIRFGPAAMRYTEARLNKLGEAMMDDLYKETVDFEPNFKG